MNAIVFLNRGCSMKKNQNFELAYKDYETS